MSADEPMGFREIGPVDGSMTTADVKAALSMRWPDDRYLHVVNAIWRAEARGREAGFKSARMRDEQLRQSMWRSVLWTSAQECAS